MAEEKSWEVVLTRPAEKSYDRLPTDVQERIGACFDTLENSPQGGANVKALTGKLRGLMRYRVGDWRVIYRLSLSRRQVEIIAVLPRGDAYK